MFGLMNGALDVWRSHSYTVMQRPRKNIYGVLFHNQEIKRLSLLFWNIEGTWEYTHFLYYTHFLSLSLLHFFAQRLALWDHQVPHHQFKRGKMVYELSLFVILALCLGLTAVCLWHCFKLWVLSGVSRALARSRFILQDITNISCTYMRHYLQCFQTLPLRNCWSCTGKRRRKPYLAKWGHCYKLWSMKILSHLDSTHVLLCLWQIKCDEFIG